MKRSRWSSYPIEQSPLFRLRSKKKLAELLGLDLRELLRLAAFEENYIKFTSVASSGRTRDIQQPLPKLSRIHVRLFDLLRRIQPPAYLKSGVRGESQITNAAAHVNDSRGFKFDIKSFFPSVMRSHIFGCFYRLFEMSPDVADLLTDLCTVDGHLPTGSTLSGDLAFIANKTMFDKLEELASETGNRMTVYVDDITVTGENATGEMRHAMRSIVARHGYRTHKVETFRAGTPKDITGVIIANSEMRVPNRRHRKLHARLRDLDTAVGTDEFTSVARSVVGMMEAADQIDRRYKVRKRLLRRQIAEIESAERNV